MKMKKHTLTVEKRDLLGRKVKALRQEGKLPATIYGKGVKSMSVTTEAKAFVSTYEAAGETGVVELTVSGETKKTARPVLIHNVQKHPIDASLVHVEFRQVDLTKKVQASVPLVQEGTSPAVDQKLGVLLTVIDSVDVEALPTELPENIVVDLSTLAAEGDEIKVNALKVSSGVTVTTDAELTVAKIAPLVTKEAEAQAAEDEAAASEAASEEGADDAGDAGDEGAKEEATPTADAPKDEAPKEDGDASQEEKK